ncbi:N-acetylneuraminate synthase family protein [Flavobacterium sp. UBA4854]|uniref:N-acetylneuraminate synthase family protein n=1 Tax=Flavobacterium sp. UBA4854 TaxID=1946548 RepID=UPI00257AFE20|nr:N-acetylneuraminate synthase family protein [Flavobacterium sp. UBA4854]
MSKKIKFGNRVIGKGEPLYFIADIGANHDGSLEKAYQLIELAKEAGADAAKFQNFQASKIVSKVGFENLGSQLSHQASWKKSVYEVYEDASLSWDWTPLLKAKCKEVGIDFFTSAYDFESIEEVDPYVDLYKIGSGDITWIEILEYTAKKGKPILIATGASEMTDVVRAMNAIEAITDDVVLMQCNTNYTVDKDKFKYVNLNVLKKFAQRFPNAILGLSDHTFGHATVLGAVALGATVIEKHFTDSNENEGPDHKFAMNPQTWREMVDNANEVYYALGDGIKKIEENEKKSFVVQRRCLRATANFDADHIITEHDLEPLRPIPEDGLAPYQLKDILGKKLTSSIKRGEHITKNHFE